MLCRDRNARVQIVEHKQRNGGATAYCDCQLLWTGRSTGVKASRKKLSACAAFVCNDIIMYLISLSFGFGCKNF